MQTWASLGLMVFFLALFVHVAPYENKVLNQLETYALTADFLTLFLGLGLFNNKNAGEMKSDGFAQTFSILVVVVNILFIGYMLYVLRKNSEYLNKAKSKVKAMWRKKEPKCEVTEYIKNPMYKGTRASSVNFGMTNTVELKKFPKALKKREMQSNRV